MRVVLQFDKHYFKWADLLLRSWVKFNEPPKLYASGVELDALQIAAIQNTVPNVVIDNEKRTENPFGLPRDSMSFTDYMICRKAHVLRHAMSTFDEDAFILMDADLLIRKPLTGLFEIATAYDVALTHRPIESDWLKVNSSVVTVKQSGKPFIKTWIQKMADPIPKKEIQPWAFFWDQMSLFEAYQSCHGILDIGHIPGNTFLGTHFFDEATVWSGNVKDSKEIVFQYFEQEFVGMPMPYSYEQILAWFNKGYVGFSCIMCQKLVRHEPEHYEARWFLGQACIIAKQYAKAFTHFSYLEKAGLSRKGLSLYKGIAALYQGDVDTAEVALRQAAEEDPKNDLVQDYLKMLSDKHRKA